MCREPGSPEPRTRQARVRKGVGASLKTRKEAWKKRRKVSSVESRLHRESGIRSPRSNQPGARRKNGRVSSVELGTPSRSQEPGVNMRMGGKDTAFFPHFLPSIHNQRPKTLKKMNTEQIRKRKIEKQWTKIHGCSFMIPKEG